MKTQVFKVALSEDPPIWRDIEIRVDQTLHDLSEAINRAFDRDSDHLYSFFMNNRPWDDTDEYCHPAADGRNAALATIESLGLRRRKVFLYLFDYGDEWRHRVTLLDKIDDADEGEEVVYPRVVASEGDSPPQYWDDEEDDDWDEEDEDE